MLRSGSGIAFGVLVAVVVVLLAPPAVAQGSIYTVAVSLFGPEYDVYYPAISTDGRYTAFASPNPWIVSLDTNNAMDVFVHDAATGLITRVSVDSQGAEGNGPSGQHGVAISGDGRYVAFASDATNLVTGDTNGVSDIFVHDTVTSVTTLVSMGLNKTAADGASYLAALSWDGRYVAFSSDASNLVSGDTNKFRDVFVYDQASPGIRRVSVDVTNGNADEASGVTGLSISGDGNMVAFESAATDLVGSDLNSLVDVFVRDLTTNFTTLVSVSSTGVQGDGASSLPSLSYDGSYVAFGSFATNLVSNDLNGEHDVFVHDLQMQSTSRVSVSSLGAEADLDCGLTAIAISADGTTVAFESGASTLIPGYTQSNLSKMFFHDRSTGLTTGCSFSTPAIVGNGPDGGFGVALSWDGQFAAYSAYAMFQEYHGQPFDHVFVVDRRFSPSPSALGGSVHRIAAGSTFPAHPSVSANGRYLAYVDVQHAYVLDRQTGALNTVSADSFGTPGNGVSSWPSLSADGTLVVFESTSTNLVAGDTNGKTDIFLHNRLTRQTTRVNLSPAPNYAQANGDSHYPRISADGKWVCFESAATNLVNVDTNGKTDVFRCNLGSRVTTLVSALDTPSTQQANGDSAQASISSDGRYVAFQSDATNLVTGDTNGKKDVFRRDCQTGLTIRISVDAVGVQADDESAWPSISSDGRYVAFQSDATNLETYDSNSVTDIFVRDTQYPGFTTRESVDASGNEAIAGPSTCPSISADGRYVAFASAAFNLVTADRNYLPDVFVRDRLTGTVTRASVDAAGFEGNNPSGTSSMLVMVPDHTPIASQGGAVVFATAATNFQATDGLMVRDLDALLALATAPKVGTAVKLDLNTATHPGKAYQMGTSFGYRPGIPIGRWTLPLNLDPMLMLSLYTPVIFQNFGGYLNGSGQAQATILIPGDPNLVGITLYHAFVVIDPAVPSGLAAVSNGLPMTLE